MALINTPQLIELGTNVGHLADRARQVQQDPAVRKAWSEAGDDVAKAIGSVATVAHETRSAWRRTSTHGWR